jgi:hypothetical protein
MRPAGCGGEPGGGAIEILFARELEAEHGNVRLARLPQHDRMMVAFFHPAQIERVGTLIAREQPQTIDIKCARTGDIAHAKFDVAGAHDIERRIEIGFADRHAGAQR